MHDNTPNAVPSRIRRAAFFLREYFFPFGCSVCGANLVGTAEAWYGLCGECRAGLELEFAESLERKTCACCGRPLVSERELCLSCREPETALESAPGEDVPRKHAFDKALVLFPYMGKYRKLLSAYKFGRNLALGNFFAEKTLRRISQLRLPADGVFPEGGILPEDSDPPEIHLVPVPPRPGRVRKTGWDQVEYLVRLLERKRGKTGGHPVSRCLRRLPSESQKELGREKRMANLRGRIVPVRRPPETALVIDDVMTTGSTLDACAAALKEAGAKTVFALSLFYD